MDRRRFLANLGVAAAWAAVPISITACGSDSPSSSNNDDSDGGVTGVVGIAGGHTHSGATVTEVMLQEGNAVTLTLTGSGHTHTVDLTGDQVMSIADGDQVVVQSSTDSGHSHTVTFN